MARYTCPSCGEPYNGRRCRNCCYEHFTEEIAHGNHVHRGEPLVIDAPQRRPIPRKDPFACDPRTRKGARQTKKKKNWVLIFFLLYFLAAPALELVGEVLNNWDSLFVTSEVSYPKPENQPAPEATLYGQTLYEDAELQIVTQWQQGEPLGAEVPIWFVNHSGRDLSLSLRDVVVNGFVMEYPYFSCDAPAGTSAMATLYLDEGELDLAGIDEIGTLSFVCDIFDLYTYETLVTTDAVTLDSGANVGSTGYFGGQVVHEADDLRITCLGYQTSGVTEMLLLLENMGQQPLDVMITEMDLDGTVLEPFFWCRLPVGTRAMRAVMLRDEAGEPVQDLLPGQALTFTLQITNDRETVFSDPIRVYP